MLPLLAVLPDGLHSSWVWQLQAFRLSPRKPKDDERNWLEPLIQSIHAQLDEVTHQSAWQEGYDAYETNLDELLSSTTQWL